MCVLGHLSMLLEKCELFPTSSTRTYDALFGWVDEPMIGTLLELYNSKHFLSFHNATLGENKTSQRAIADTANLE